MRIYLRRTSGFYYASLLSCILLFATFSANGISAAQPEYGGLLADDELCSIWWAEAGYKIMRTDPVPSAKSEQIGIRCAINEYEPFQLVIRPKKRMDDVRVEISPLRGGFGFEIIPDFMSICHVEYVKVTTPTDEFGQAGWWPDPLPPYEGAFTANPGENHPLWITVHVPLGSNFGPFEGVITVTSGTWKKEFPIRLNVWSFILPEETTIRSSFGLYANYIKDYHNLETDAELKEVYDLYLQNFREHRMVPTSPLDLYPMRVNVEGLYWEGGEFVSTPVHGGARAIKLEDNSVSHNIETKYRQQIMIQPGKKYTLSWYVMAGEEEQEYTALIQCYNAEGEFMPAHTRLKVYKGSKAWKQESMEIADFLPDVSEVSIHLLPTFRDEGGAKTGIAYFDDVTFGTDGGNLPEGGDFEMDVESMSVNVDFTEFDIGAKRFLDEFKFNSFHLPLQGLGTGSFHSRQAGVFAGFVQGTPEYEKLMQDYLGQVQTHLEENGWLGKEYIYWFDEPNEKDYDFVREGMINIRKGASKLTRFITEHQPGPKIMDVSEISCTVFHRVDPKIVADLRKQGREFWSYLCTGPKGPWVTLFTDHPGINLRMWLWMSYAYQLEGILVWSSNYWTSDTVFPRGMRQNPWVDPMSYRVGYGTPSGQVNRWGNGDGRFLYPPNRNYGKDKTKYMTGPVNSIRWEMLREGIEDHEYLMLLEKGIKDAKPDQKAIAEEGSKLLTFPETMFKDGKTYSKDPQTLFEYRAKVADVLDRLIREYF